MSNTIAATTLLTSSPATNDTITSKMMTKCHRPQRCQMQYYNGALLSSTLLPSSSLSTASYFYGLNKWLWTAVLFGLLIVTASAIDENSKLSPASTVSSSLSPRDEIYIDDEGIDGSGRGGIHDDLEKDHDFSGSGFGPDDEDSDSDYRHNTHTHQTGKSNINKNIDDNEFITTSRNNNQNQNKNHQTSSNSGINNNNNQGNTGFISSGGSSATSGNTGLNTIDKNNDNNNNERNEGKIAPPPKQHHDNDGDDDDDFDIEEEEAEGGIVAGSGDGGFIDRNNDNDDDDHTGDVDENGQTVDEVPDITKYQHGHGVFNSATPSKTDREHSNTHDGDDFEEVEEDHFDSHQPIDHDDDNEEEEDDDHVDGNVHKTHSEDGTEIYTDITDESSTGSSSSTTEKRPGGINNQGGTNIHDLDTNSINSLPPETKIIEQTTGNEVLIMNANDDDRTASFFAQPGILAAVIGGAVVGLLCAILVVMFIVYRMRKKDEGSYALDEPKRSPAMNSYAKNATNREFYA